MSDNNNTPTPKEREELLDKKFPYFPKDPIYGEENQRTRKKLKQFISKTISQEKEKMIDKETPKIQALVFAAIASGEFQKDYGQLAIDTTEKIKNLLQNK